MDERNYSKELEEAILKQDGISAKRILNEVGPCGIEDVVSKLKSDSKYSQNIIVYDSLNKSGERRNEETIKLSERMRQGAFATDLIIPVVEFSFQPCEKGKH